MAANPIPPMDTLGPKSELSKEWCVWLRGFTYFAEGKANLQNPTRKRNKMLYQAGTEVQDIFKNLVVVPLPEGQADDLYQQAVRALNTHFHVQKNAAYERHVLRQLQQEPGEDVDSFVLGLRKQARYCDYADEELEFAVRDQLLKEVSSQELRTKLFEVHNIKLAETLTTARAWETERCQANILTGGEGKSSMNLVQHRESKGTAGGQATHKCYACGRPGHFVGDKVCPVRGKVCAKCGRMGPWAICCRYEADGK